MNLSRNETAIKQPTTVVFFYGDPNPGLRRVLCYADPPLPGLTCDSGTADEMKKYVEMAYESGCVIAFLAWTVMDSDRNPLYAMNPKDQHFLMEYLWRLQKEDVFRKPSVRHENLFVYSMGGGEKFAAKIRTPST